MFQLKYILWFILIFGAFSSIMITIVSDVLFLASTQSVSYGKKLVVDIGRLIIASQDSIEKNVIELSNTDNRLYSNYLFSGIISGSLLTIFFIFIVYKISTKLPFFHTWPPIYIAILSFIFIGFVQVFTTYVITHELVYPYHGWLAIIEQKDAIIHHLEQSFNITNTTNISVGY